MSKDLTENVAKALSGALAKALVGGDNRETGIYLSLVRGGYPVNDDFFEFTSATPYRFFGGTGVGPKPENADALRLWEKLRAQNEARQRQAKNAAAFASIVDAIPLTVGDWAPTASGLGQFYRDIWLEFIDVPEPSISAAAEAAYAKARKDLGYADVEDDAAIAALQAKASQLDEQAASESDVLKQMAYQDAADKVRTKVSSILDKPKSVYSAYAAGRNAYQNAVTNLNLQLNTDPSDDVRVRTLRDTVNNALQDWQVLGNKAKYERAMATVAQIDSTNLRGAVEKLKKRYDDVLALNDAGATPFVPVGLVPGNFATERGTWTTMTLDSQQIQDASSFDHTITSGGSGPGIFWRADASNTDTTTRAVSSRMEKLKVTFDVARVALDRTPWLDTTLLTSRMWRWADGADQRSVSDGNLPPAAGSMLPMYATDVVLVRNARVSLAMTQSESTSFKQEMTRTSRRGFWIFSSSSRVTETTERDSYTWDSGTATVSFPGMQIAGFICARLPKLPNPSF